MSLFNINIPSCFYLYSYIYMCVLIHIYICYKVTLYKLYTIYHITAYICNKLKCDISIIIMIIKLFLIFILSYNLLCCQRAAINCENGYRPKVTLIYLGIYYSIIILIFQHFPLFYQCVFTENHLLTGNQQFPPILLFSNSLILMSIHRIRWYHNI